MTIQIEKHVLLIIMRLTKISIPYNEKRRFGELLRNISAESFNV